MDQIRVAVLIQVLNSFVGGVFTVALPLVMAERQIGIATMGLVFASLPMIFQLSRIFFATVSDFWGRKLFFALNGVLGGLASLIYYVAYTPLEFLFGKVMEGMRGGSLWAVNRPFFLEKTEDKWAVLVYLRATVYLSSAVGSLVAGFLVVWLFFKGTLLLCALIGGFVVPATFLLVGGRRERFTVGKALGFLDLRKKDKVFKVFLVLFFMMGLSFGFRSGFVFPLFLSENGFNVEAVGVLLGLQILLAGLCSYVFARKFELKRLLLVSGILYTSMFSLIGFSSSLLAGLLVVVYGVVEGLVSISQEGILSRITDKESYGIDIGLLMMGLHIGSTISLALSGFLISFWGYAIPFLLSALTFAVFFLSSNSILEAS